MLGFMPRLYDDELLYSWLARYHLYSGNDGPSQTMKELFGSERAIAVADLPTNLVHLNEKVKHFTDSRAEDLLLKHTFFLYYTNFLTESLKERIQENMLKGQVKGSSHMLTGMMASSIKENRYFRFCPICKNEDLKTYGETYWRLTHQLPGVHVCTKHNVLLQDSLQVFRPDNKHAFHAATRVNCIPKLEQVHFTGNTFKHLLAISEDLVYLSQNAFEISVSGLEDLYKSKLLEQGYASFKGIVDQQGLATQMECYYGRETLLYLQSGVKPSDDSFWLKAITRKHRKAFHPIRHALLMRFLGVCIQNIHLGSKVPLKPFGDGPFPCLNPAAEHFHEKVINTVLITKGANNCPVGHFKCSCGFHYMWKGPDRTSEDLFKIDRKIQLGQVWQTKLQQLIQIEKVSFRAAARILHVDVNTVIKYSESRFTEPAAESTPRNYEYLKESKKREWLELRNMNPELTVTELRGHAHALYAWLYRNDKDWLFANVPTTKVKRTNTVAKVDWHRRDIDIYNSIVALLENWDKTLNKHPTRRTISSIGKSINNRAILEKQLNKLPRCKRLLSDVCESIEEYRLRRINWAIEQLLEQGMQPAAWQVNRLAAAPKVDDQLVMSILNQVKAQRGYINDQDFSVAV
ncbi:TnsD family Tn7-like transposition protein [Paenibacillus naphthalenovorans]|uniref:TnsD family Tn7-like transposition protein n=1 Tax=Paenibacillus naphthalenovorans TaxID=162209 RepID=UPI00088D5465|nr:TnsD family Tn7-like transposition protein [Paenibacillus naphthalenovorans]SDJ52900.1 TniQ protein [Paenibacillus naphthalenovorans]